MKIKNINGTSSTTCSCGSWLRHWEKFSGQNTQSCPAADCGKRDLVGAHVQKAESSDNKWYVYPLCKAHNQHAGILNVSDSFVLVPANRQETCEK